MFRALFRENYQGDKNNRPPLKGGANFSQIWRSPKFRGALIFFRGALIFLQGCANSFRGALICPNHKNHENPLENDQKRAKKAKIFRAPSARLGVR